MQAQESHYTEAIGYRLHVDGEDPIALCLEIAALYAMECSENRDLRLANYALKSEMQKMIAQSAYDTLRSQLSPKLIPTISDRKLSETESQILCLLKKAQSIFDIGIAEDELESRIGCVFFNLVELERLGAIARVGDRVEVTDKVRFEVFSS